MDEELTVDPMKQDFHFYAMDNYEQVKQICESQLAKSIANGSILQKDKENQIHLLTTSINTRLLQNWEAAPMQISVDDFIGAIMDPRRVDSPKPGPQK